MGRRRHAVARKSGCPKAANGRCGDRVASVSINYYGIRTADRKLISSLVEGTATPGVSEIDVAGVRQALLAGSRLTGKAKGTLTWKDDEGGYVFVDVAPTCALVTQGTGGGDRVLDVMIDVVSVLNAAGLNIFDPQRGSWFPGSPVKPKSAAANTKSAPPAKRAPTKQVTPAKPKVQPVAKKQPARRQPAKKKPTTKLPTAKRPTTKKPTTKKPTAKKSSAQKSSAQKS